MWRALVLGIILFALGGVQSQECDTTSALWSNCGLTIHTPVKINQNTDIMSANIWCPDLDDGPACIEVAENVIVSFAKDNASMLSSF